jgi:hypothetical protein
MDCLVTLSLSLPGIPRGKSVGNRAGGYKSYQRESSRGWLRESSGSRVRCTRYPVANPFNHAL